MVNRVYEGKGVNEDYIIALRRIKNSNALEVFKINLDRTPFCRDVDVLNARNQDETRDLLDFDLFVKQSSLTVLVRGFNFCLCLDSAYQELPSLINRDEYIQKIDDYNSKIYKENSIQERNEKEKEKRIYIRNQKEEFIKRIKCRVTAFALEEAYKLAEQDKNIVAYSNRKIGYENSIFKFDNDFIINYKTNFGYGYSSFFTLNLKYKDIDILPYSNWVSYRFADKHDIIRYTRKYPVNNKYWEDAMRYSMEIYNFSIKNPEEFVSNIILNECYEMVHDLEDLFLSSRERQVEKSFFLRNESDLLKDDELVMFKSEKITGALEFIDGMSKLSIYSSNIDQCINRILECNKKMRHLIIEEIQVVDDVIVRLNSKIANEEILVAELKVQNDEYCEFRELIRVDLVSANPDKNFMEIANECRDLFEEKYPEYKEFSEIYFGKVNALNKLIRTCDLKKSFRNVLVRDLKTIEDFSKVESKYNVEILVA